MRNSLWWVWPPAAAVLSLAAGLAADHGEDPFVVGMLFLAPLFAFLAALIGTRVPGNVIAWLLLPIALSVPVAGLVSLLVPGAAPTRPTFLLAVAVFLVEASWIFFIFPILLILFLFPTGAFLTSRWRWGGWLTGTMVAAFGILSLFAEEMGSSSYGWTVENPIGFIPASIWADGGWFAPLWGGGLAVLAIGGLLSMVFRYRHSGVVARTQIRWFIIPAVFFAAFYALSAAIPGDTIVGAGFFGIGFTIAFASLPVAMTIAITRYRLYEIDRIVSRTVTYVVVLGVLGGMYAGLVLALRSVVPVQGPLPVALSTLAVAFAFSPLLRRVQAVVDRRFFRSRYDAAGVVAAFADELRSMLDPSVAAARVEAVVKETFQAELVSVWLAQDPE